MMYLNRFIFPDVDKVPGIMKLYGDYKLSTKRLEELDAENAEVKA